MGSDSFTYNDDFGDNINFRHQQYYMEGKLDLLDNAEEWFYDWADTKMLHLMMPETEEAGACPDTDASEDTLRGRTLDYGLEITDSHDVIIANMTFWACNIKANEDNNAITLDSLTFEYPSSSHRMLRSEDMPKHTKMFGDDNQVINCTFYGAEGPGTEINRKYSDELYHLF